MDLFEPDCNLVVENGGFGFSAENNDQFGRRSTEDVLQEAFTELNRILVTDGRAALRTNEAIDPNEHLHLGVACPPSMRCGQSPMITVEQKIGFYREWSSRAARQALSAMQRQTKERCTHSAGMWSLIADTLEAGNHAEVASLTRNLAILKPNYLVPVI